MKQWFQKLTKGLAKTSNQLGQGIKQVLTKKKLTVETLQDLEDLLLQADIGPSVSQKIIEKVSDIRFDKEHAAEMAMRTIVREIESILKPYEKPLPFDATQTPFAILMTGVNGTGKTTTTAKLAHLFQQQGLKVSIAACDTFRAAAVEQLDEWGKKLNISIISRSHGSDAAGLAYDAYKQAQTNQEDIILFDTAGRLHTNTNLMEELSKISRVLKKINPHLPQENILVIDGTTGQNAYRQVEVFQQALPLTGLIVTKLDGTAKGGIVVGLAERFKLPIYAVGIGEQVHDLQPFDAHSFAVALLGMATHTISTGEDYN